MNFVFDCLKRRGAFGLDRMVETLFNCHVISTDDICDELIPIGVRLNVVDLRDDFG